MKLGRTFIITLLFLIAAAVYLFQRRIDRDIMETTVPDEVSRSFSLKTDDEVSSILVRNHSKKTELTMELSAEGWALMSPLTHPADKNVVQGFILALRHAAQQTRLRAEKDWAEYGLEKPALEIELKTSKGKKGKLAIGDASPMGNTLYARWTDEQGYILLPVEIKSVFDASVYNLQEKRIFFMPPEQVEKVFIEMGSNTFQWKKENGKWFWLDPVEKLGKELPAGRMDAVLSAVLGLYVKDFLYGNKKTKDELGFYIIQDRISLKSRTGESEIFHFGNEVPVQNAYYGMKDEAGDVFLVERTKVYQLLDLLRAVENEQDARDGVPLKVISEPGAPETL